MVLIDVVPRNEMGGRWSWTFAAWLHHWGLVDTNVGIAGVNLLESLGAECSRYRKLAMSRMCNAQGWR
jgi:hypothetical protein